MALMHINYCVRCLKKKNYTHTNTQTAIIPCSKRCDTRQQGGEHKFREVSGMRGRWLLGEGATVGLVACRGSRFLSDPTHRRRRAIVLCVVHSLRQRKEESKMAAHMGFAAGARRSMTRGLVQPVGRRTRHRHGLSNLPSS